MTVAEFLVWTPPTVGCWQLVDGVALAMAPASPTHAAIQAEVGSLIRNHLRAQNSPCRVIANPGVVPRVQSDCNMRIPDLAVVCGPIRRDDTAAVDPVLLIEILSPGNKAKAWINVWAYTTIPSAREILVIHSTEIGARLLRRQDDGSWPAQPLLISDGALTLDSVGFQVSVESLYAGTWLQPAD